MTPFQSGSSSLCGWEGDARVGKGEGGRGTGQCMLDLWLAWASEGEGNGWGCGEEGGLCEEGGNYLIVSETDSGLKRGTAVCRKLQEIFLDNQTIGMLVC